MTEQPDLTEYLHGDLAKDVPSIDELERRMSVLFNQPCPTMAQRIQRFSNLNRMQKKVAKVCVPSAHAQFELIWISHRINYFTRACTDPILKYADPGDWRHSASRRVYQIQWRAFAYRDPKPIEPSAIAASIADWIAERSAISASFTKRSDTIALQAPRKCRFFCGPVAMAVPILRLHEM